VTRRPTPEEWSAIQSLFDELLDLPQPARLAKLNFSTPDSFIREEVQALLASAALPGLLDERPETASADPDSANEYSSLARGAEIGAFRIERLIGRGGAGEVYLAKRREADFEQQVAIKLLRPETVSRMASFDAERRVLSVLEHPGIARLIDGGLTPDGRAFMAMEYVDGTDIVSWCKQASASLQTRLTLFEQVCDAVAYAHRRLIVHRDLKPSNIMVDREGRVRLLDFGVARIIETSGQVQTGTVPFLTPEYAAPEQLENRPPTTSADVYGLGAVLFELLTGRGPWRFDDTPLPTVLRRLLHDDPPVPSRAAAETPNAPIPPRRLEGDLDAIILKAMRRNPAERYESVAALSDDLARHLSLQPVKAREGSSLYLAQRFIRRHRWGVAATAAGVAAILIGAGGVAWQARATAVERDIARAEAARAEAVNQSVSLMFRNATDSGRGGSATAKELLDDSTTQLLAQIDPKDASQSSVVLALAELYSVIDDTRAAESLLDQALAKGVGRTDTVATANLKLQLASVKAGMSKFDDARRLLAESNAVWRTDPDRFRIQQQESVAAEAYMRRLQGDRNGGLKLLLDAMPEAEKAYAGNSRELVTRYANLVLHLMEADRLKEADALLTRAEAAAAKGGVRRSSAQINLLQLRGGLASRKGDFGSARRYLQQAVDLRRELYGPSTALAIDLLNLGRTVMVLGEPEQALGIFEEAQPMAARYLGAESFPVMMISLSRIDALCALHRPDDAEPILAQAERLGRTYEANSLQRGLLHRARAFIRIEQGRNAEARADLDAAEAIYKKQGPAGETFLVDVGTLRTRLPKG
jgi:tetratricopeptide (TPR) repeat protein/predicted Ser/Thr protein kinase